MVARGKVIVFVLVALFVFSLFPSTGWAESTLLGKLKFFGDLRLRSEYEVNKSFNKERYRWRQRYRLRFGVNAGITDNVDFGLRLASGERSYQTTGNQTLDGRNFEKFDFTLDRVFAKYKRDIGGAEFTFRAGKFGHPFWYPTEIVWDMDLQPQGLSETIRFGNTTVHLAQYVIRQADRNDLPGGSKKGNELYAFQVIQDLNLGGTGARVGVAYYSVADAGQLRMDAYNSNSDFTTNKNFNYYDSATGSFQGDVSDFNLLNINALLTLLKESRWPLKIVGEYVKNLGAESITNLNGSGNDYGKEDTAWLLGIGVGTKKPGTWRFWLSYSQIEADSVVANFNSDDLQQTNVDTIFPLISYQITKNMSIYYDGYYQKRNNYQLARDNGNSATDDTTQYRHRINWKMSF